MDIAAALELSDGQFTAYLVALATSGIIMLVLGIGGFGAGAGSRILSALFGLGFFGYSVYLAFFFDGDEFRIFVWAFVLPILFIVNVVRSRRAQAAAPAAPAAAQPASQPAAPAESAGPTEPATPPAAPPSA